MPMVSNLRIDVQRLPFTGERWVELIFRVEAGGTVHTYRQNVEADHFDSLFNLIFDQAKQALAIAARTNQRANTVRREPDPQVAPYDYAALQRELERRPFLADTMRWNGEVLMNQNLGAPAPAAEEAAQPATSTPAAEVRPEPSRFPFA